MPVQAYSAQDEPDEAAVIFAEATHDELTSVFDYDALGSHHAKGGDELVPVQASLIASAQMQVFSGC